MNWKKVLKTERRVIVVFIILFFVTSLIPLPYLYSSLFRGLRGGLPLYYFTYYEGEGIIRLPDADLLIPSDEFLYLNFIIDIIFWYIISISIILIYNRVKKK